MVVSSALLILGKNGYLVDFVVCMCNCVYMYVVFTHPMRGIRIVEDHKINIIKRVYFNFTAFNFVLLGNTICLPKVSLACGSFWTEYNQGSKDSGRNFDLFS